MVINTEEHGSCSCQETSKLSSPASLDQQGSHIEVCVEPLGNINDLYIISLFSNHSLTCMIL